MKYFVYCLFALSILVGFASAQETAEQSTPQTAETAVAASLRPQFGVALVTSFPAPLAALSLQADLGSGVGLELRLAPFGVLSGYALKGSYTFTQDKGYQIDAFVMPFTALSLVAEEMGDNIWATGVGFGVSANYAPYVLFGVSESSPFWNFLDIGLATNSPLGGPSILVSGGAQIRF